jgi:hypothetical protein
MIPIKGYATFDPLKHCLIGKHFSSDFFKQAVKNPKVSDPLRRIADETEEDFQALEKILKDAGVHTYRPTFDESTYDGEIHNRPPVCPRDEFAVIGETFYATRPASFYADILKNIDRNNLYVQNWNHQPPLVSTATICRVGKDIFWDRQIDKLWNGLGTKDDTMDRVKQLAQKWKDEGFRVHESDRGYHSDGAFCVVKPGCIVSLREIQDYETEFPGWDVLYLPDQSWDKVSPFLEIKEKVKGRWWVKGEEQNEQLIEYVNTWLDEWVGYVEETVFDVNMLSIDQNTIICNNYNKEVFEHFKRHKVEPIVFNFRHRYFWDGGVHCITQDLYREGTQEDYFG